MASRRRGSVRHRTVVFGTALVAVAASATTLAMPAVAAAAANDYSKQPSRIHRRRTTASTRRPVRPLADGSGNGRDGTYGGSVVFGQSSALATDPTDSAISTSPGRSRHSEGLRAATGN